MKKLCQIDAFLGLENGWTKRMSQFYAKFALLIFILYEKEKTAATEDTTTTDCDCIQHQNHYII